MNSLCNLLLVSRLLSCLSAVTWKCAVKTEKKTVQFSEEIQVETIEPEQEPVFIDEVNVLSAEQSSLLMHMYKISTNGVQLLCYIYLFLWTALGQDGPVTADDPKCRSNRQPV